MLPEPRVYGILGGTPMRAMDKFVDYSEFNSKLETILGQLPVEQAVERGSDGGIKIGGKHFKPEELVETLVNGKLNIFKA